MRYGTEEETRVIDEQDSSITTIKKYREFQVVKEFKKHQDRTKVANKKEEMAQYLIFTELLTKKRLLNRLVVKDEDPTTMPSFRIEYPKYDTDGCYFTVMCWTEVVD